VRYVLMMCGDETELMGPQELRADLAHQTWLEDVQLRGVLVTGQVLRPAVDATTVRVRERQTVVTDGPFAETKDIVGGFAVIECADLDEAVEVAARHPYAARGCVEIRPVWPD
jgi:hypothetical protein